MRRSKLLICSFVVVLGFAFQAFSQTQLAPGSAEKIEKLALAASSIFEVQIEKNLVLLTIRHYTKEIIEKLTPSIKVRS